MPDILFSFQAAADGAVDRSFIGAFRLPCGPLDSLPHFSAASLPLEIDGYTYELVVGHLLLRDALDDAVPGLHLSTLNALLMADRWADATTRRRLRGEMTAPDRVREVRSWADDPIDAPRHASAVLFPDVWRACCDAMAPDAPAAENGHRLDGVVSSSSGTHHNIRLR